MNLKKELLRLNREEKDILESFQDNKIKAEVPPIYQSSLFHFSTFQELVDALHDQRHNYVYSRGKNPTVNMVEEAIAELEGGESCLCFSSGMSAISAALLSCLKSGDHIIAVSNIYGPTIRLLQYLHKFGITYSVVDSTDIKSIEDAIRDNTKVIYLESPTTMTFKLVDLPEVAKIAKPKGIYTIIDNSWATPLYQKPLQMGIDIVVHSASKYLGGHSDIVAGALITSEKLAARVFQDEFLLKGSIMSPMEAWLLLRGLKTLSVRMEAHQKQALQIAYFLKDHPAVKKVNYPALKTHPDYELGRKLLTGYSGLLSFELADPSFTSVEKLINSLEVFKIGVSWGGADSLVLSPNHGNNAHELLERNINPGLIRISVGLESINEQIKDLTNALDSTM